MQIGRSVRPVGRCGQIKDVTEERWNFSPEQDKSLQRIQLLGVVLLGLTVVALNVFARLDLIDYWALVLSGFALLGAMVMALALLAVES